MRERGGEPLEAEPGPGARLAAAAAASLSAVFVLEPLRGERGRVADFAIAELNERAAQLLGRPRGEVVGRPVGELFPEYRRLGLFERYVDVLERGVPSETEVQALEDLAAKWLSVQIVPVAGGIAVSVQDVSERKRAERRLEGRNAVAQVLARATTLEAALPDLLEQVCVTLGWGTAAYWRRTGDGDYHRVEGWPAGDVGPAERRLTRLEEAWERGGLVWGRSRLFLPVREAGRVVGALELVPAGGRIDADVVGTTAGIADQLGAFLDRGRAQVDAERSQALLGATLESAADGILAVDGDGRVVGANGRFRELWGIPQELLDEADDALLIDFVLDQLVDPASFRARVRELYADAEAESLDVIRFKDGRVFERYSRPRRVGDVTVGRVWSFRDVTGLVRTDAATEESERLEALGRLAGGVAHDFNNLLTVVLGATELALVRLGDDRAVERLVRDAHSAAERAAGLTRTLLAFGRRQILEPRVVDVNAELSALEIELAALAGASVEFELRLDPDAGSARVDPFQLVDVLRQLVENARAAMPEGGRLTITTAPGGADAVELAVADTGVGMDATTRARLFEPFFTTRSDQGAAGLGLAAVHGVVKQSGGDVVVESAPGCGTTVTVRLPRVDGESVVPPGTTEPGLVRPTILLVEDEPLVRDVTAEALSDRGYEVLLAANGAEALELVSGRGEPIGLLVTDVIMPGMDGRQLADRLRELQPGLRVLFVSGHADSAIFAAGSPAGFTFLQKPYAFDELGRKVAELLAG